MKILKSRPVVFVLKAIGPSLVWIYLQLVGGTQRLYLEGRDYRKEIKEGRGPFLFAFWHSRLLFPAYFYRGTRVGVLVSPSRDGEYIARIMDCFGLEPLRGSSWQGAAPGLLRLARHIRSGYSVAVTPDGPRGPREHVQLGVIQLAKMTGLPVIPCAYSPRRRIVLNSWDRFLIPLPLCRGAVVYREPVSVPKDADREQMLSLAMYLESEIHEATRRSEELIGSLTE